MRRASGVVNDYTSSLGADGKAYSIRYDEAASIVCASPPRVKF